MNDPSLDEPMGNEAQTIEKFREEDEAEEDEQFFLGLRYVLLVIHLSFRSGSTKRNLFYILSMYAPEFC